MAEHEHERLKKALDSMIFLPHLRDRQAKSNSLLFADSSGGNGRPWDRGDLFRRLQTFKASTWFAKPTCVGPVECARRGWENVGVDLLTCESCKVVISCPVPPQLLPNEAASAAERFAKQLSDSHAISCPWRSTTCSLSLLKFPRLSRHDGEPASTTEASYIPQPLTGTRPHKLFLLQSAVSIDFRERCCSLQRLLCLPPMSTEASTHMLHSKHGVAVEDLLRDGPAIAADDIATSDATRSAHPKYGSNHFRNRDAISAALTEGPVTPADAAYMPRLRALALCGWSAQPLTCSGKLDNALPKETNSYDVAAAVPLAPESCVLVCTLCGSRAGLWNNFPECTPKPLAVPTPHRIDDDESSATKARGTDGHAGFVEEGKRAKRRSASLDRRSGEGLLARHVALDLSTTIAGGWLGGLATKEVRPSPDAPVGRSGGGSVAKHAAGAASATAAPVFGIEALRAKEPGAPRLLDSIALGEKRKRDAVWNAAVAPLSDVVTIEATGEASIAFTAAEGSGVSGSKNAAALHLDAAALRRYKSKEVKPLDPFGLHRMFCPWVHTVVSASAHPVDAADAFVEEEETCGWQWFAKHLGPEEAGRSRRPGSIVVNGDAGSDGGEPFSGNDSATWDPAGMLRNILSKVEVAK